MPATNGEHTTNPLASGWWTSELGVALITIAGNIITLLVLFKVIPPTEQADWTDRLTAIISLLGVVFGNTSAGLKFIHSRQAIKQEAIRNPKSMLVAAETAKEQAKDEAKAEVLRGPYG